MSPQSKDFAQLQAENAYLRDENTDLRRQLYNYRVNFGHPSTPGDAGKDGAGAGQGGNGARNGVETGGGPGGNVQWEAKPDQPHYAVS